MTSGTPFRSDNNRILGNWINYASVEENVYECLPDFRYTLANALEDETIPPFSFVTLAGEFTYRRGEAHYEGQTFTNAQSEQELTDALNTAIFVEGDWVKTAIEWAHGRMKRDRQKCLPECATYVRVPTIQAARQIKERILRLTGEDALVVVSKDDDPNARNVSQQDSSKLIEKFASETGATACSWIIGVAMLGEGVSINRLKYRIHATNVRASLSFMQDLGRLLRKFPKDEPEPVETLIPAHPYLIELAKEVMNEVAHVIREEEEETDSGDDSDEDEGGDQPLSSFEPLASTGELAIQIADGEEISGQYTTVAEWAIANKAIWRHWSKTPAHLAQMLQKDPAQFNLLLEEYQRTEKGDSCRQTSPSTDDIPFGFPSEYANWLPDEKAKYASKQAHTKAQRLAHILYPSANKQMLGEKIKDIHTKAKQRNGFSRNDFIPYEGWEKIYTWLCDRIVNAAKLKGTEDL